MRAIGGVTFDGTGAVRRVASFDGTIMDITAQKAAEDALRESTALLRVAKDEAVRANKAKDEFIAALSHELRTPLTPVLLAAQSLQEDAQLPAAVRDDLRMIQHNVSLEVQLIDDLLDLTRITRGKLQIARRRLNAEMVLRRAIETGCGEEMKTKSIALQLDFQATEKQVLADEARLSQIFWNIAKNAVKFTAAGGAVTVRTRNPDAHTFEVRVIDNGVGISAEKIAFIFDAFEQGGAQVTRRFGGLGLGLAISRALVELHDGRISAASQGEGRGAEFVISLPIASAESETSGADGPRASRGDERGAGLRILLVEDHPDTARTLHRLLTRGGHEVHLAITAAAALAAADEQTFDLVVSDLGLPDKSGHELMRELRDAHGLRGIALSGYGMEADLRRSAEVGFTSHLVKPIDFPQLREMLRKFQDEAVG